MPFLLDTNICIAIIKTNINNSPRRPMPEQEHDESRKKIDEDRARYEAAVNAAAAEAKQSEDRYAEILEKISKQLEDMSTCFVKS